MLLWNADARRRYGVWTVVLIVVTAFLGIWYAVTWFRLGELPGGSSPPGLFCGVVAFVLFLFESALVLRKTPWLRTNRRIGSAKGWLEAHIFLGIFLLPLVLFHTRMLTHWGGTLTTIVAALFVAVYLSGWWGLLVQQWLPRRLLQTIPHETIYSQIPSLTRHLRDEAELLVVMTCGPRPGPNGKPLAPDAVISDELQAVVKAARKSSGAGLLKERQPEPVSGAQLLWTAYDQDIKPFLAEAPWLSPIAGRGQSAERFRELRDRLDERAHNTVNTLERLCEQRRQLAEQAWLHRWLHWWLWVHLLLSMALLTTTLWHAVVAVLYW